jgi:MarR family transcriptional regulator for hemolysin
MTNSEHELDAPPWQRVESTLMATSRLIRRTFDSRLSHLDVNLNEAGLLVYVDEHGPMSQRQLADALNIGRAAAGVVIGSLESRRLIERRPDPDDGRAVLVGATATGRRLAEKIVAVDVTLRAELRAGITRDERAKLAEVLTRLQVNLAAALDRTP